MKSDSADETSDLDELVSILIDGKLTSRQATQLQSLLSASPAAVQRYLELLDNHEALCAIYPGDVYTVSMDDAAIDEGRPSTVLSGVSSFPAKSLLAKRWALAAAVLLTVGLGGYFLGSESPDTPVQAVAAPKAKPEQVLAGHAMLRRSVDLRWKNDAATYREGDVIPGGLLQLEAGVMEIDFFCGATLIVEGPASLEIQSDWSVSVESGRLRANVPPAARGFIVQTAQSEIIDLGTEFSLDASPSGARVEVIDGEVAFRGGTYDGVHLTAGQHRWLGKQEPETDSGNISNSDDVQRWRDDAESSRFARWQAYSLDRRRDERLIAHYPITDMKPQRVVSNAAASGSSRDAALIGPVQRAIGRFGQLSSGLEFDRIGARARTRIDGDFDAFTFSAWVRIDSLDHVYNALFMSDGYETGELHWQIRDDGALMFSVMVDDTQTVQHFSERDGSVVNAAGLHRVYVTQPFWDISKSGQWFHLAAVYDPASRQVTQYVNGQQISNEPIEDKFFIDRLKIGPAEIGNWGQPFRKTPWFAVRNLNGTIDELAIYNAALQRDEVRDLYEQGKPLGY